MRLSSLITAPTGFTAGIDTNSSVFDYDYQHEHEHEHEHEQESMHEHRFAEQDVRFV